MSEQRPSAIVSWEAGRLDVFRRGIDGKMYHKYFQDGWGADRKFKRPFRATPPARLQPGDPRERTGWTGPAAAGGHSFKLADQVIE